MVLFEKLNTQLNLKEFFHTRDVIGIVWYLANIVYFCFYWILVHDNAEPAISTLLVCLFSSVFLCPMLYRACSFFFTYNWFYSIYLITVSITLFTILWNIKIPDYGVYVLYEIGLAIVVGVLGFLLSAVVSFPFKTIYLIVLDAKEFYYSETIIEAYEQLLHPEKKNKKIKENQEKNKFDVMNETQLNVELNLAVKEDRFEDAEKIKNILNKKFS